MKCSIKHCAHFSNVAKYGELCALHATMTAAELHEWKIMDHKRSIDRSMKEQASKLPAKDPKKPVPFKGLIVPLGTVVFDCVLNGKVVVTLSTDGKTVFTNSDVNLKPGAMTKVKGGLQYEKSPVLGLFCMMMQANKDNIEALKKAKE